MKTLKDYKPEEIAQWRAFPITQAVIEALKSLRVDAEQEALSLIRGDFKNDSPARVMSGIGEGISKSIWFMENGK